MNIFHNIDLAKGGNEYDASLSCTVQQTFNEWSAAHVVERQEPLSPLIHSKLALFASPCSCIRGFFLVPMIENCVLRKNFINISENCAMSRSRANAQLTATIKIKCFSDFSAFRCHFDDKQLCRTSHKLPRSRMHVRHQRRVDVTDLLSRTRCTTAELKQPNRASAAINFKWQIYEKWMGTCASASIDAEFLVSVAVSLNATSECHLTLISPPSVAIPSLLHLNSSRNSTFWFHLQN